jgi:integrase
MRLTDKSIQAIKPKNDRYEVWEEGRRGFGMRITPRGVKTFIWMYRVNGKTRRLTLGAYPRMSLYEAHKALLHAQEKLARGKDPGNEQVELRREAQQACTVVELVSGYIDKYVRPQKRSAREDERILNKDVLPLWGSLKARDVSKREIIELLENIVGRGAPIAANRTLACVRKMFNWAFERDIIPNNPCYGIKAPAKETHRERVLTSEEMKALWHGLDTASMSPLIRLALKLQLVTAQRKSEILSAQWADIDFGSKMWTIPAMRAKNGLSHRVPLPELALDLLNELRNHSQLRLYVFPSKVGDKSLPGSSVDHALLKSRLHLGVANVTPHDLRRSAASHMASLGVSRLIIAKLLNHVDSSVTSIYDRYSYDKEKRDALDLWGSWIIKNIKEN